VCNLLIVLCVFLQKNVKMILKNKAMCDRIKGVKKMTGDYMKKIDTVVLKETRYIAIMAFIFSLILQSVFLISGKWDYTVLLGNILGYIVAVGNFFLLGLTVQKALEKDPNDAKNYIKASQSARLLCMFLLAVIGFVIPVFNILSMVITYLFPRLAIAFRPVFYREGEEKNNENKG